MTTMELELTPAQAKRLRDVAEAHELDIIDVMCRGLSTMEEKAGWPVPPIPTFEEACRSLALSLEQAERGERAPGTGKEAIYRALQEGIARSQAKSRSQSSKVSEP